MFLSTWHSPDCWRKIHHAGSNSLREERLLQLRALRRQTHTLQDVYAYTYGRGWPHKSQTGTQKTHIAMASSCSSLWLDRVEVHWLQYMCMRWVIDLFCQQQMQSQHKPPWGNCHTGAG